VKDGLKDYRYAKLKVPFQLTAASEEEIRENHMRSAWSGLAGRTSSKQRKRRSKSCRNILAASIARLKALRGN